MEVRNEWIDMNRITPNVYLGSYKRAALNQIGLKKFKITHILTVGNDMSPEPFPDDFIYKIISIHDSPDEDISIYFDECIDFISNAIKKNNKNKVLIHCWAGISRSSTITIAYLMREHRLPLIEAMESVRESRHIINPNKGFKKILENYSRELGLGDTIYSIQLYGRAFKSIKKLYGQNDLDYSEKILIIESFKELFGEYHPFIYSIMKEIKFY